ncbi:TPA: hypothetical protein N0F65_001047 [Lagenidium giganteum]|uniref:Barwin domain-containing protein n=1 Tax=Lagenidium giganteum TaxID=4803 RepID=A0AAV2YQE0_9STRA|nr:TPA: hypothetical protein N0F65_001047 [Lagenidium giganteum]
MLASVVSVLALASSVVHATSARATYHIYDGVRPEQTFCNLPFNSPGGWMFITAYQRIGGDIQCGQCLKITNTRTGASTIVKVVDQGGSVFDLSQQAFNAIDTDGNGYNMGHMNIDYVKVAC